MMLSREILLAYVEGELPPEDERRVASELAKDAELHAYVEEQKRLKSRLQTIFAPALEEPGPAHPEQTPHAGARWSRPVITSPHWLPVGVMAAGIALGVLLAGSFGTATDIRSQGGILVAQSNLSRILTTQLASEQNGGAASPVHLGVSFFSKDGYFCRSFDSGGVQGTLSGIACREGRLWRIAALAAADTHAATALRAAGIDTPAAIRGELNAMMVGEPLNEDAERAARSQGWRAH